MATEHELPSEAAQAWRQRLIRNFDAAEKTREQRAPLHRHMDSDDCGGAAAYLLSDDARNVTGTTLYVDAGYHAMGM